MKIDNKFLLGIGVAVVGYYLWQKSKSKKTTPAAAAAAAAPDMIETEPEELEGGNPVVEEQYFAKEDIILGVIPNSGQPNVLFRKGDPIIGKITTRSGAFGGSEMGIMAAPTVSTALQQVGGNNLHFVPFGKIEIKKTTKYYIGDSGVVKPKDAKRFRFTNEYTAYGGRGAKRTYTRGKEISGILNPNNSVTTKSDGTAPTQGDIQRAWSDAIILYTIPMSVLEEVKNQKMGKPDSYKHSPAYNPFKDRVIPQINCIAPPCNVGSNVGRRSGWTYPDLRPQESIKNCPEGGLLTIINEKKVCAYKDGTIIKTL